MRTRNVSGRMINIIAYKCWPWVEVRIIIPCSTIEITAVCFVTATGIKEINYRILTEVYLQNFMEELAFHCNAAVIARYKGAVYGNVNMSGGDRMSLPVCYVAPHCLA